MGLRQLCLYLSVLFFMTPIVNGANEKLTPEVQQRKQEFRQKATAKIRGQVIWPGHDLTHTTVQLYTDEKLQVAYTSVLQLKEGYFEVSVEAGTYYLVAFVDVNQTAIFDFGDGMGIYGISDWSDSEQQKKVIRVVGGQTVDELEVKIAARLADLNGKQKVVPVEIYKPSKSQMFQAQLELISSGVSGELSWGKGLPQILFKNALVMAYTDASWNYKVAQTAVGEDGQFKLNIQRGKYYLMAIIDKNENNRFDIGDYVGAFGIQNLRADLPVPVFVEPNRFIEGITVEISGRKSKNGRVVPIKARMISSQDQSIEMVNVNGTVIGRAMPFEKALVIVYTSPALLTVAAVSEVRPEGKFSFSLPDGEYYLLASVDVDQDGKYSDGDVIGGYGTLDLVNAPPQPLMLSTKESTQISGLEIVITARYGLNGQLTSVEETPILPDSLEAIESGISGHLMVENVRSISPLKTEPAEYREAIISVSKTDDFSQVIAIPVDLGADGFYQVPLVPDDYYVMIVVDLNGDRKAGLNDGVGIFGTRRPVRGQPQLVSVYENQVTPNINIEITATYMDEQGNIAEIDTGHRSEIRIQYGQPDDVYQLRRGDRQIEEWWYWTQGVGFSFEPAGLGWRLENQQQFEPKIDPVPTPSTAVAVGQTNTDEPPSDQGNFSQFQAQLFYSYDGIIWAYSPTGQHQPLEAGDAPSVSPDGRLIYRDNQGNIMLQQGDSISVLLDRQELATDAVISPDGSRVAFARQLTDRGRIFIQDIDTNLEISVPSVAAQMGMPAWDPTGELLAYVETGDIDSSESPADRDIYSYDLRANRIDPISVGETDDIQPAWSPTDLGMLAFCRVEGKRQQIWLIRFDDQGLSTETKLTTAGGQHPVWLPDGSGLVYENNGQLWTVAIDKTAISKTELNPVKVNGKPVFGHRPDVASGQ
ncbi:MAG: hypothetical protein QGG39_01315 [Candidatus Poribacteria bacterium]|nr:hypothetical protein [Candidatus Poribacteria bacterium]